MTELLLWLLLKRYDRYLKRSEMSIHRLNMGNGRNNISLHTSYWMVMNYMAGKHLDNIGSILWGTYLLHNRTTDIQDCQTWSKFPTRNLGSQFQICWFEKSVWSSKKNKCWWKWPKSLFFSSLETIVTSLPTVFNEEAQGPEENRLRLSHTLLYTTATSQ